MICKFTKRLFFDRNLSVLLVLVYSGIIFILSSIPMQIPYYFSFDPRKLILHFLEYSVLGFLSLCAFCNKSISILFSVSYGVLDEVHQYFVPGRFFDFYDMFSDTLGSIFGVVIMLTLLKTCNVKFKQGRFKIN